MELSLEEIAQEGFDYRTIQEWSEEVGVSRMSIHNWIKAGHIDYWDVRKNRYVVLTCDTVNFKGKR